MWVCSVVSHIPKGSACTSFTSPEHKESRDMCCLLPCKLLLPGFNLTSRQCLIIPR